MTSKDVGQRDSPCNSKEHSRDRTFYVFRLRKVDDSFERGLTSYHFSLAF